MTDKFDPEEVMEVLGDEPKAVKQYPKFQISKFLDSKRDYQVVVRTESFSELKKAMEQVKPMITLFEGKEGKSPESKGKDVTDSLPEEANCPEHNVPIYKRTGKYGVYYSHKQGEGWCNKKPREIVK